MGAIKSLWVMFFYLSSDMVTEWSGFCLNLSHSVALILAFYGIVSCSIGDHRDIAMSARPAFFLSRVEKALSPVENHRILSNMDSIHIFILSLGEAEDLFLTASIRNSKCSISTYFNL